mmetsp:Transcript_49777/g.131988  ORF Transcript_49777/g.131988 Transcript_49777/m.131988 type:complete len:1009 (-) Transcript_49777:159-3185(-)
MEGRDPGKEHKALAHVLGAQLEPPSNDLVGLVAEFDSEGLGRQLDAEMAERVLMARLSAKPLVADRLAYLRDCSTRIDELSRGGKFPACVVNQLPPVQQLCGNYAALSLTCAAVFGAEEVPLEHGAQTLTAMFEKRELPLKFLNLLADSVEEEEELARLVGPLLTVGCERMKGRDLVDQKNEAVNWVASVCAGKGRLAKLLVTLPVFKPTPGTAAPNPMMAMMPMANRGTNGEGFRLQTESLLGWTLSPTCIDTALYKEKSARQMHFQNLRRKSRPAMQQGQNLLRHSLGEVFRQADSIVAPLLRTGEGTREAVLCWFGSLITGTESRTKSANMLDEGGGPAHFVDTMENSPMPMHHNLDMRLGMQIVQARLQGFATPGMAMNTTWCLLKLTSPIKMKVIGQLDPYYILQDGVHAEILGGFQKESRFGDSDEVEAAAYAAKAKGLLNSAPKFTTQVFWVTLRALHVLLMPVLKEETCFAYAAGYFQVKDPDKMEAALGEHFAHEVIVDNGSFLEDLAKVLNLSVAFLLLAANPEKASQLEELCFQGSIIPETLSAQWSVIPSCVLEDVIDILEYYIKIRSGGKDISELFTSLNAELMLMLVTFMLGSSEHVKNPNLRGKAATILMSLAKQPKYLHLLESSPVLTTDIMPACIRVFTAVEKTKQSYYDIRMQLKYQLRIPILELFEKMLPLKAHQLALKTFAVERADEFLKFLNQMMNDATMQLEEGLDTLVEVRKLVSEGGDAALARPSGGQLAEDEQTGDGGDLYRRSRADPKEHCRTYMGMGHRTIRTLWSITREAPSVIVGKLNVLQQLLHNCLNACLDRLVGPRCLELKGGKSGRDFEEFNFKPKELLQMIAEMFVFVGREDKDRVQKMITEDGRSYRPKTFQKALQILRRENMIGRDMLADFERFVQELNALATAQEAALAAVDIPDNYLDPIMSDIMEDPVLLPTSNTIMDRKVIERHIMSNDDDPFNRAHLAVKDLVPQTELRDEIRNFCIKHGIAIGGDS